MGHIMSVTQCYLAMNDTHFILHVCLCVIECDVYVLTPSVYDCICADIFVSSLVLKMFFLFLF